MTTTKADDGEVCRLAGEVERPLGTPVSFIRSEAAEMTCRMRIVRRPAAYIEEFDKRINAQRGVRNRSPKSALALPFRRHDLLPFRLEHPASRPLIS